MKKSCLPVLAFTILFLVFGPLPLTAQLSSKLRTSEHPIPNRYIVVLEDTVNDALDAVVPFDGPEKVRRAADELSIFYGGKVHRLYFSSLNGFSVEMSARQAEEMSQDARVRYVEEDFVIHAEDTQFNAPWGLDRIDQLTTPPDANYNYLTKGVGVHAYVIDSGIRATHVDFGGRVVFGADFVGDGQGGNDCNGHGTHVAGIIGGTTYGVAKNVTLHNIRVLGCDGTGFGSGLLSAIDWVTSHRIMPSVANVSIGLDTPSLAVENAIANSISQGVNYALAAGNESADACSHSPGGRVPTAVTVGSSDFSDSRTYFSNYGPCVDIFAPGGHILSAGSLSNTSSVYFSGTSMAAPHVAGAMARLLEANPANSPADIKAALISSASLNVITAAGEGSPNRLLYVDPGFTPPPGATIRITNSSTTPNPATVTVSGRPGVIANTPDSIKVKINGFTHTYSNDLRFVLVSPTGTSFLIQSKTGGDSQVTNVNYSISDSGADHIPATPIVNGGNYRPTARTSSSLNPPQGVTMTVNNPGPVDGGSSTFASTFGDTNPNGVWKLYISDYNQYFGDSGTIASWSLEITTTTTPADPDPVSLPSDVRGFIGYDSFTKGNWIGKYGSEGWIHINGGGAQPTEAVTWLLPNIAVYNWQPQQSDERAFMRQIGTSRGVGAVYSATQFDITLSVTDGRTHRIALYFVDLDGKSRSETIQMIDRDTGSVLDTRSLSNFNGGKYLIWQITGNVTFRMINNGGASPSAVLSGIFIEPHPTSTYSISGRVMTNDERGITNAVVTLTAGPNVTRQVTTGRRGAYSFTGIPWGQTVQLVASSRRFFFNSPRNYTVTKDLTWENFFARPTVADGMDDARPAGSYPSVRAPSIMHYLFSSFHEDYWLKPVRRRSAPSVQFLNAP